MEKKMQILKPNVGQNVVTIPIHNVFVSIIDYGKKSLLCPIKISVGQHSWCWITLKEGSEIDISGIGDRYCSFENAINREVNDPYTTVYMFETFDEMVREWDNIKYNSVIKTKYEGKQI